MADVQAIVAKWARNGKASAPSYIAGIQAVTESPTAKAARNVGKYQRGVQEAVESGKYQRGLNAVTKEQWQQACLTTGAQRLASGYTKGESKFGSFMAEYMPFVENVSAQVNQMPDETPEDRDQRMLKTVQLMRGFRRQRR